MRLLVVLKIFLFVCFLLIARNAVAKPKQLPSRGAVWLQLDSTSSKASFNIELKSFTSELEEAVRKGTIIAKGSDYVVTPGQIANSLTTDKEFWLIGDYLGEQAIHDVIRRLKSKYEKGVEWLIKGLVSVNDKSEIQVRFEILNMIARGEPVRILRFGGCGQTREDILRMVPFAISSSLTGINKPPSISIAVEGSEDIKRSHRPDTYIVRQGVPVVLNACNSRDPESDNMIFSWNTETLHGETTLESDSSGPSLTLTPREPGSHKVNLSVSESWNQSSKNTRSIYIMVLRPPIADARRIGEKNPPRFWSSQIKARNPK